jgi:hypothetical protein
LACANKGQSDGAMKGQLRIIAAKGQQRQGILGFIAGMRF